MSVSRRTLLKVTGGAVWGTTAVSQLGSVSAQNGTASVTLNAQESDGDSVVVASLQTDVDARLYISPIRGEDDDLIHKQLDLSAGTSFSDRTIQLDQPMDESKTVSAVIQAGEDFAEVIADDTALIAVDESLTSARAGQIPGGEVELVAADSESGFDYPYLLYRPETRQHTARPLFVQPHNSLPATSRDELVEQLYGRAERYLRSAIELSLPGLVAGFPRTPEDGGDYVQSLALEMLDTEAKREAVATDAFPAETLDRVDRQLVNMVEDARQRLADEAYPLSEGIHMEGFSASGSFSTRFALLYPEQVGAMSLGGGGARPLPLDSRDDVALPYPLGTADYGEWTDRSFDRESWAEIDQYIWVGQEDQPLPETDRRSYYPISVEYQERAEAVYGINRVTERFPVTRSVYDEAGTNATFTIYEGVGHRITREIANDIVQFHRQASGAQHATFELTLHRSADRVAVGTPVTVTVQVQNLVAKDATARPTLSVDGTDVETIEQSVAANSATELSFDYVFEAPGSYSLSVNGRQVGDGPITVTEPTPTATATSTAEPSETTEAGTETTQPGFGAGGAVTGVLGLGYLLANRDDD